jgi:uncharacterized phage infection (PIP) family protein YhgE
MDVDVEILKIQSDVAILKQGLQASIVEVGRLKVDQGSIGGYAFTLGEGINQLKQHVGPIMEGINELNIDVERCSNYQLTLTESMVALRDDMSTLRTHMREDMSTLRTHMREDRMDLRKEMADMKGGMADMKGEMADMKGEMREGFAQLKEEARNSQTELREGFAQLREEARSSRTEMGWMLLIIGTVAMMTSYTIRR